MLTWLRARAYELAVKVLRPPPCGEPGKDGLPCGRHVGHRPPHVSDTRIWSLPHRPGERRGGP